MSDSEDEAPRPSVLLGVVRGVRASLLHGSPLATACVAYSAGRGNHPALLLALGLMLFHWIPGVVRCAGAGVAVCLAASLGYPHLLPQSLEGALVLLGASAIKYNRVAW